MKQLLLAGLMAVTLVTCKPRMAGSEDDGRKTFVVSGLILVSQDYCGGAEPDEETMQQLTAPHPSPNTALIIRGGATNQLGSKVFAHDTTDAEGRFEFNLPTGEYCLSVAEKENARNKELFTQVSYEIDSNCDSQWLKTCELTFRVEAQKVEGLEIRLHQKCFIRSWSPCIQWTGELPP